MTNEEAIECLEYQNDMSFGGQSEALKTAIKALEQNPCEDCISRQAVLDFIEKASLGGWVEVPESKWTEFVMGLPLVTPTRPKGKWIHPYEYGTALPEHYCSECRTYEYSDVESNFCSSCGADMRECE